MLMIIRLKTNREIGYLNLRRNNAIRIERIHKKRHCGRGVIMAMDDGIQTETFFGDSSKQSTQCYHL